MSRKDHQNKPNIKKKERANNIKLVLTANNASMILNFGRNIIAIANKRGIETHVILSKFQSNKDVVRKELEELNVIIHEVSFKQEFSISGVFNTSKSIFEIYGILRKLKPDIIHTRAILMGFLGRVLAYFAGVKGIYYHQDDFNHREENIRNTTRYLLKKNDLFLSKITTKLFFVSETIKKEAINIGIDPKKCVFVGHDLHPLFKNNFNLKIQDRHELIKHTLPMSEETFVVGTIARIVDFKGIDTIVKVAKEIKETNKNIKFFIRGNGSKFDKYDNLIKEEQLLDTVFLVREYLASEDMPALFKSFDIFFLPTRREGFGMVFAEAMGMGVPVICSKIYPVVEVVPENLGYVIAPEDIDGYKHAILELYEDANRRAAIASKAQDYAMSRWGGEKSATEVIDTMVENLVS